jgi:hypothetical protein
VIAPTGPLAAHGAAAALAALEPAMAASGVPAPTGSADSLPRVSLAAELRACLAHPDQDPERFEASVHRPRTEGGVTDGGPVTEVEGA